VVQLAVTKEKLLEKFAQAFLQSDAFPVTQLTVSKAMKVTDTRGEKPLFNTTTLKLTSADRR